MLDQHPLGPVDEPDFLHFLLHGGGLFFQAPQPFPGGTHPFQSLLKHLGGGRFGEGEHTMADHFGVDFLVNISPNQQQDRTIAPAGRIDGKPGAELIRQRGVDDNKVKRPAEHFPSGSGGVANRQHRIVLRSREHLANGFKKLLGGDHQNAVGLLLKDHNAPSSAQMSVVLI